MAAWMGGEYLILQSKLYGSCQSFFDHSEPDRNTFFKFLQMFKLKFIHKFKHFRSRNKDVIN